MATIVSATRSALGVPAFLMAIYLAYACMYLGPSPRVRRWGTVTWWRLARPSHLMG